MTNPANVRKQGATFNLYITFFYFYFKEDLGMARDDYYVIVYKILSYLYQCLKLGKKIDEKCIDNDNKYISINLDYWKYIIVKLIDEEYISNVQYDRTWCGEIIISNLDQAQITPKGIEYLDDNSLMEKAKKFLKETKEIMPFI